MSRKRRAAQKVYLTSARGGTPLAAAETGALPISEGFATGAGLIIMILLVASAVALFISVGGATEQYRFLDTEPIETEYGVSGMEKERQKRYREVYNRCNIAGVCACILSVLPIFCAIAVTEDAMWVMAAGSPRGH